MKEIKLEDIFNEEKKQGVKEFIKKQKQIIINIMEKDEELGLYEEEELLSDCCGAPEWQDETGICNECREHAEFSNNQE